MVAEEEFILKVKSKLPSTLAESSVKSYVTFVRNLKKLYDNKPLTNFTWMKDTTKIVEIIQSKYALNTQKAIYNSMYMVLKSSGPKTYKKTADFFYDKVQEGRKAQEAIVGEKTEKQEAYWMTWDDIVKKRDELTGIDKVILSLYTMIPPGRALEFATMKVNGDENSYENGKFIIRKHKTSKDTGIVTVDVPDNLRKVLDEWLDGRKTGLLLNGLTAPSITKHLNKMFAPKKIGVSALRHLYLEKYSGIKQEMMADSRAMRHSVNTALTTYVK